MPGWVRRSLHTGTHLRRNVSGSNQWSHPNESSLPCAKERSEVHVSPGETTKKTIYWNAGYSLSRLTLVESRVSSESRWVVGGADSLTRPHPQSLQSALRWMDAANRCNTVKNQVDGAEDISGARRRTCDLTRARTAAHTSAQHTTHVSTLSVSCVVRSRS